MAMASCDESNPGQCVSGRPGPAKGPWAGSRYLYSQYDARL